MCKGECTENRGRPLAPGSAQSQVPVAHTAHTKIPHAENDGRRARERGNEQRAYLKYVVCRVRWLSLSYDGSELN